MDKGTLRGVGGVASLGSLGVGYGLVSAGWVFLGATVCLWVDWWGASHVASRPDHMAAIVVGYIGSALASAPLLCIGAGLVLGGWRVVARELRHRRDCALARETDTP
jgi:hypothetical protein